MRFSPMFVAIAVLSGVLAGCSAERLPDYTPLSAQQYSNQSTQNGLTLAIQPMTEEDEVEKYFGTDLLDENILPILVVAENRNADSSFIIRKQDIKLLSEEAHGLIGAERSESVTPSESAEAVGAAGAILLSIPLILISVGLVSEAAEIERNFAMKELQQAMVSPGDAESGFVYFQLPEPADGPDRWRLQVQSFDTKTKTRLLFDYGFDLERN